MARSSSSPASSKLATVFKYGLAAAAVGLLALIVAVVVAMTSLPDYDELAKRNRVADQLREALGCKLLGAVQQMAGRARQLELVGLARVRCRPRHVVPPQSRAEISCAICAINHAFEHCSP